MYDIIVIGAGPAGMTAALYALRSGKTVLVLEKDAVGGQIAYSPRVENFPAIKRISGAEFADALLDQIMELGADIEPEGATGVAAHDGGYSVTTDSGSYDAKCVIIATGVKQKRLMLDGEERLTGRGVSYCSVCDGAFYRDKTVAVNGGGNTALDDALFLSDCCKKVYVIHRRDTFRAEDALVSLVKRRANVEFILESTVAELIGEDSLSAIVIKDVHTGSTRRLDVDCLFVAIGREPINGCFSNISALDEGGYFISREDCVLDSPGVFVAGDCREKRVRQLTTAVSDGAVAAIAAVSYIDKSMLK